MTSFADLHIHTHFSDSTSSPEEVVIDAVNAGLKCIAITDHDTLEGVRPTQKVAESSDLEVIAGVEFSSETYNKDIHVLGYFLDMDNARLCERLQEQQKYRVERVKIMLQKLKDLGIADIAYEEVSRLTESDSVGRPHVAEALVQKGAVKTVQGAFQKYLGDKGPVYVSKLSLSTIEVIKLIKQAGGLAVLAHPMVSKVDEMIRRFSEAGLDGLEVYYPNTTTQVTDFYKGLAKKNNLLVTGGSDAHGDAKPYTYVGKVKIPYQLVEDMKARLD